MNAKALLLAGCLFVVAACAGKSRPAGPPPEYEAPRVRPWDAGRAIDPLEAAEQSGQWVEEAPAPTDAGAPSDAVRGARDAGKDVG